MMSKRDMRFLAEIDSDSRRPLSAIAGSLGISQQLASYKLRSLQDDGVLGGFYTVVDYSRLGYSCFRVYFSVNYSSSEQFRELIKSINGNPYAIEVNECGGRWDLVVAFLSRNASRFNKILRSIITENPPLKNYDVVTNVVSHCFGRKYLGCRPVDIIVGGDREPVDIPAREMAVLAEILTDARVPLAEISRKLKINPKTAQSAISRLGQREVIKGFRPVIDPARIGYARNRMLVKYHNLSPEREKEMVSYCRTAGPVTGINKVLGKWDLEIELEARPGKELRSACMAIREGFQDIIKESEVIELFSLSKKSLLTREALGESRGWMVKE